MTAAFDANLFTSGSTDADNWRWVFAATVTRVVDADTLCLSVDVGFGISHTLKVRLLGINCPELNTPEGVVARSFVVSWLEQHGAKIRLQTVKDKADSFGRYLAYVSVDGHCLNDELIAAGHAVEYRK